MLSYFCCAPFIVLVAMYVEWSIYTISTRCDANIQWDIKVELGICLLMMPGGAVKHREYRGTSVSDNSLAQRKWRRTSVSDNILVSYFDM